MIDKIRRYTDLHGSLILTQIFSTFQKEYKLLPIVAIYFYFPRSLFGADNPYRVTKTRDAHSVAWHTVVSKLYHIGYQQQ